MFFKKKSEAELLKEYNETADKLSKEKERTEQRQSYEALTNKVKQKRQELKQTQYANSSLGSAINRAKETLNNPRIQNFKKRVGSMGSTLGQKLGRGVDNYGKNQARYDPLAMPPGFERSTKKQKKDPLGFMY
jgi:translation initiation factor 2B subunit (eIF-2B alpha/beta/delta family)